MQIVNRLHSTISPLYRSLNASNQHHGA